MAATTLATLRVRSLQEWDVGFNIPNANITALVAQSFTSPLFFANSDWGGNKLADVDGGIHRPTTATAADIWRGAGRVTTSTGLVVQTGAAYTDTTLGAETIEIWKYGLRPDTDFLNAANRALEWIYYHSWEPLTLAADPGCREAALASWGVAVNATAAKQVTVGRVFPGLNKSVAVTNTSANGYQPTASIGVSPGELLVVIGLSQLHSGTASQMVVWDVTNNVAVPGSTVTHLENEWQFSNARITVPTGCHNIHVRLGGTGASDVTDWQTPWVYRPQASNVFILPQTYLDERFKIEALAYTRWRAPTPIGVSGTVYQALSMDPVEIPPSDYSPNVMGAAVSPTFIQFHGHGGGHNRFLGRYFSPYFYYPLWVQMKLPWSEQGLFTTDASSTNAPLHLLLPAVTKAFYEPVNLRKRVPNGDQLYGEAVKRLEDAQRMRTVEGPAERQAHVGFRGIR